MSEKEKNNFINKNIQYKKTSSTKTGYSNSRLSGNFCTTSQPKLSFDRMTIVGNLNKHSAKKLSDFMSYEPKFRLWDILQTKFKAKALEEKVYIEYDKIKADTWDRRNMRVEFNPNNLSSDEMLWLKFNV
ncbi:replication initiation protein, partial [Staphylococcus aureus]|nr:replication initiation protein [Staphylococcus aureus]